MRATILAISALTSAAIAAPQLSGASPQVAAANVPGPADGGPSCAAGAACSGDVTHFDIEAAHFGACGFPGIDGNNYLGIALPHAMMGAQSDGNPYCGKTVTVTNPTTGVSVVGTVMDKCGGCGGRSIDLTNAMWNAVASGVDGRGHGFTWSFTEAAVERVAEIDGTAQDAGVANTGACEGQGAACVGEVRHWSGGLGACGWNVNGAAEYVVALPHGLMGTQSNNNPYCGRSVTIKNPHGATVQATVGDKCMGCEGTNLDLTDALFANIAAGEDGVGRGYTWWFN